MLKLEDIQEHLLNDCGFNVIEMLDKKDDKILFDGIDEESVGATATFFKKPISETFAFKEYQVVVEQKGSFKTKKYSIFEENFDDM